ncbi:hypothetical protein ACH42_16030 [Endozoicomonas sp. (ex Bugula neritina AB1)]|nr:hypothetical protein ACH42_16030 [Endozoicomonas sp. (ex Bugula neritina AB1)]
MPYVSGLHRPFFGFTLPELLVTLAVASILLTFAASPVKSLVADRRVAAITSEIYGSLVLARSEAIKQQTTVSVCSTVNNSSCDETNSGWQHGWLVFSDKNRDGVFNDGDQLIRAVSEKPSIVTISWNRGYSLSFNSRGQTSTAGSFEVCESSEVRAIVISMTGRARVEERVSCS